MFKPVVAAFIAAGVLLTAASPAVGKIVAPTPAVSLDATSVVGGQPITGAAVTADMPCDSWTITLSGSSQTAEGAGGFLPFSFATGVVSAPEVRTVTATCFYDDGFEPEPEPSPSPSPTPSEIVEPVSTTGGAVSATSALHQIALPAAVVSVQATATVTVLPAGAKPGGLPNTGDADSRLALLGVALVLAGSLIVARRRLRG